ncbi:MAG: efflux transporter outer membrane subunit [Verrucomicrobia bacterium]|nr:efflux transporter outer membrane subunit [Verrucomicrobiota bacterium]
MCRSVIAAFLLLMGCTVGPKYCGPCQEAPPCTWKNEEPRAPQPLPAVCVWWEIFEDPCLNALEQELIANNPNLDSALARIDKACAEFGIQRAALTPEVGLNPYYSVNEELFKLFLPGPLPAAFPGLTSPFRIRTYQFILPVQMKYEVDLWGKRRNRILAAYRSVQAYQEAYCAALLTLTTDLGSSYFRLRALDAEEEMLKANLCVRKKAAALAAGRYENGLINAEAFEQANVDLANAAFDLQEVRRVRGTVENLIAALVGRNASEFCLPHSPLVEGPPEVPAGLPCCMLLKRPDLALLEREMAAEHAKIGVAYAELFPSCNLTTNFGYFSPTLADFLSWKSRLWSLGVSVFQALWDGGKRRSQIRGAWASYREASGAYQSEVLTAFKEVEDALNDLKFEKEQSRSLMCAVEGASKLLTLSRHRYEEGLINSLEVINSESAQIAAERNAIDLLNMRYQSTLQLIKALGGSWENETNCLCARN